MTTFNVCAVWGRVCAHARRGPAVPSSHSVLTPQVLRYTALASGIVYGAAHLYTLKNEAAAAKLQHAYDEKVKLIAEAKAAYAATLPKKETSETSIDLEDPKADFAAFILGQVAKLEQ